VCNSLNIQEFLGKAQDIVWSRNLAAIALEENHSVLASLGLRGVTPQAVCLCPAATKAGDEVCILYGCSVPVILRRKGAFYVLVGESFLHGIMFGEAMKSRMFGRDHSKMFDIV
jgi:hypothetical protein